MLENIKKVDKKIIIMAGVLVGIILIILIAVLVISLTTDGTLSFEKIEEKVMTSAQNYYADNGSLLPSTNGESKEVEISTLVSGGYIKDLSNFTDEGVTCGGRVHVTKTANGYDYVVQLDCGEKYKTTFLVDKLIENIVTSGNGLYDMEAVAVPGNQLGVDSDGYDLSSNELMKGYIYRGDNVNNFIQLDGVLYRIIKIDGNNDFVITTTTTQDDVVYDDRYNSDIDENTGINDYPISRIYDSLSQTYNSIEQNSTIKKKGVPKNVCIAGRLKEEIITDGSIECSKVMKEQYFGLIPVFDILNASLSEECIDSTSKACTNYNYLITSLGYWTATPSAISTYGQYAVGNGINLTEASSSNKMKHVYYLSNKLVYVSGNGTLDDPYIVK